MAKAKKKSCLDYALEYIYRYPKTEKELKIRLLEKHYSEEEVENTIQFLKSKWRLDDRKFAEAYIRSEIWKKWKPKIIVYKKLLQKWVDKDIVDEAFRQLGEEIEEGILQKIEKEIKKLKQKWKNWFDIIQILLRRWYHLSDIKKVLNKDSE